MPDIDQAYGVVIARGVDDCEYDATNRIWVTNSATIRIGTQASPKVSFEAWVRFNVGSSIPYGSIVISAQLQAQLNNAATTTHTISTIQGDVGTTNWSAYPSGTLFYAGTTSWSLIGGVGWGAYTSPNIPSVATWLNARTFGTFPSMIGFKITGGNMNTAAAYENGVIAPFRLDISYYPIWKHRRCWGDRHTWTGWSRPAKIRLRCRHNHERHLLLPD